MAAITAPLQEHTLREVPPTDSPTQPHAPNRAPPSTPSDPWHALCQWALTDPELALIAKAEVTLSGGRLRIALPAGSVLARVRRAATRMDLSAQVSRHYPTGTQFELCALTGTATAEEAQRDLRRTLLADPACRRDARCGYRAHTMRSGAS